MYEKHLRYSLKSDSMKSPTCTIMYENILATIRKSGIRFHSSGIIVNPICILRRAICVPMDSFLLNKKGLESMSILHKNFCNMHIARRNRGRLCPMSEIVCFLVLIFTYSHVENSLFFALDLAVSL